MGGGQRARAGGMEVLDMQGWWWWGALQGWGGGNNPVAVLIDIQALIYYAVFKRSFSNNTTCRGLVEDLVSMRQQGVGFTVIADLLKSQAVEEFVRLESQYYATHGEVS